jgi:hypothetical protein
VIDRNGKGSGRFSEFSWCCHGMAHTCYIIARHGRSITDVSSGLLHLQSLLEVKIVAEAENESSGLEWSGACRLAFIRKFVWLDVAHCSAPAAGHGWETLLPRTADADMSSSACR